MAHIGVLLYYDKRVHYGLNAIVASIDSIRNVDVHLIEDRMVFLKAIKLIASKYDVCVVGFSLLTTMLVDDSFLDFIRMVNNVVNRTSNCISIIGGPHASGDPIGSIVSLGFKYVFIGEAEHSLRSFLVELREGGDISRVKGLVFREDGRFIYTGKPKPIDLNDYPPFPYWRHLFNPIEISRGCPYGCRYCQVSYMHGFNMRHRSIESITKYAEIMVREGIRDIRFISPNSLAYLSSKPGRPNHEVLEELFTDLYERVVKKYGARIFFGTFPSEVRPDYVDEDVVSLLKRYVSNKTIIVGAQTGSNKLLNRIGRGHSIEDVFNAVKAIHKHGFTASIDFIIGLPSESDEDLKGSLNAIKKLVKMGAKIHLHTFIPLPGTPFAFEKPRKPPKWFIKEIAKIIGMGRAYGEWMHQARIAEKIIKLREKGLIMPKMMSSSSADH